MKSAFGRSGTVGTVVSGIQTVTLPAEAEGMEVFDLSGRKVWSYLRRGPSGVLRVELPKGLANGLLRVRYL